eukprot:scaffold6420_cov53-Phaeocystis_antarctica.AAC.3
MFTHLCALWQCAARRPLLAREGVRLWHRQADWQPLVAGVTGAGTTWLPHDRRRDLSVHGSRGAFGR